MVYKIRPRPYNTILKRQKEALKYHLPKANSESKLTKIQIHFAISQITKLILKRWRHTQWEQNIVALWIKL